MTKRHKRKLVAKRQKAKHPSPHAVKKLLREHQKVADGFDQLFTLAQDRIGALDGHPHITPELKAMCRAIAPAEPIWVTVAPTDDAKVSECHINARNAAERCGGTVQHGWSVFVSLDHQSLITYHHSVVKLPDGTLVDVSPSGENVDERLFIPDNSAVPVYYGRRLFASLPSRAISPDKTFEEAWNTGEVRLRLADRRCNAQVHKWRVAEQPTLAV